MQVNITNFKEEFGQIKLPIGQQGAALRFVINNPGQKPGVFGQCLSNQLRE
jgi:hypothetical protein